MPVKGMEVKEGELRKKENDQIFMMGMKVATTKVPVKLTSNPSVNGAHVKYEEEVTDGVGTDLYDMVPVNTQVTLVARTLNKEKVGKMEDYWYLVNAGFYTKEVWIHGQYLKTGK